MCLKELKSISIKLGDKYIWYSGIFEISHSEKILERGSMIVDSQILSIRIF